MESVRLKSDIIRLIIKSHQSNRTMSLRDFAKKSGLSPTQWSLVQNGKTTQVRITSARKIADSLGVGLDDIATKIGGGRLSPTEPSCSDPVPSLGTPPICPIAQAPPATPIPREG